MSRRIMVTGGTGFVGSHVVRQLFAMGAHPRLLVRNEDNARALYQRWGLPAPEWVVGDITRYEDVQRAVTGCDGLVHAAATTPVKARDVDQLVATNVQGTENAMRAAVASGLPRVVYLSSITTIFNTDASKVSPDAPLVASTMPYGRSKVAAEAIVRDLQEAGAPIAIVYPAGVIGPDDPGLSDALKALVHRVSEGFRITEGGMQHIDVRDLAGFITTLLAADSTRGRHVIPGPYLHWSQVADVVERVSGCELVRVPAKGWQFRALGRFYDCKRWFTDVDSPISAETMRYSTQWPEVPASAQVSALAADFRTPDETFADSLRWLAEAGYLPRERLPKLFAHAG